MAEAFGLRGIEIVTVTGVERIEKENGRLRRFYAMNGKPRTLAAETIVLAIGWPGNVVGLTYSSMQ
jgi:hypothetical protein